MDEGQVNLFWQQGFIILEDFFSKDELAVVTNDINLMVDELAEHLLSTQKIKQSYTEEGLFSRLTAIDRECPGSAVKLHTTAARSLGRGIGSLFTNPRLLDVVEALLGPDIAGHPEWNIRPKTPSNPLFDVPWHQDTAYLEAGNEAFSQVVAWVPLSDVDSRNGSLQVVKGAHKLRRCFPHHIHDHKGSWYLEIDEPAMFEEVDRDIVTCSMKEGSLLLFTNVTPHRSTPNYSSSIRWSVDIRFMRPHDPSGFSGVDRTMTLRTKERKTVEIDWGVWGSSAGDFLMKRKDDEGKEEESEEISGPWMDRWKGK